METNPFASGCGPQEGGVRVNQGGTQVVCDEQSVYRRVSFDPRSGSMVTMDVIPVGPTPAPSCLHTASSAPINIKVCTSRYAPGLKSEGLAL